MRELKRSIAKANIRTWGIVQFCRPKSKLTSEGGRSFFAVHWRDYAAMGPMTEKRKRRTAKKKAA